MKTLVAMLDPLIVGNKQGGYDDHRQIFLEPPHLTFDNHFSVCHVTSATMESKMAQYEKLIVAATYYKAKDETKKD